MGNSEKKKQKSPFYAEKCDLLPTIEQKNATILVGVFGAFPVPVGTDPRHVQKQFPRRHILRACSAFLISVGCSTVMHVSLLRKVVGRLNCIPYFFCAIECMFQNERREKDAQLPMPKTLMFISQEMPMCNKASSVIWLRTLMFISQEMPICKKLHLFH